MDRCFSLLRLMSFVSLMALGCAILRVTGDTTIAQAAVVLPMLGVMLLGLTSPKSGQAVRLFWTGFNVSGLVLVAVSLFLAWSDPESFFQPYSWLREHRWLTSIVERPEGIAIDAAVVMVMYGVPQALAAFLVGSLTARYQIVRRPRVPEVERAAVRGARARIVDFSPPSVPDQRAVTGR